MVEPEFEVVDVEVDAEDDIEAEPEAEEGSLPKSPSGMTQLFGIVCPARFEGNMGVNQRERVRVSCAVVGAQYRGS